MKTIHKYYIKPIERWAINMQWGASLLHVGLQGEDIFIWAEVDLGRHVQTRVFGVFGTGNPLPDCNKDFIGTVLAPPFVWHVYEL